MNFSCNKCQRRYSIADEKVRGKTVKVRCKNCQNVISVEGPPVETEESTRVVSLADVERLREQDRSLAEEDAHVSSTASLGAQSWEDEPTRTMPVRDGRLPWFVMIKSKQEGPLEEHALRELLAAGTLSARSYFWQQTMADWKRGQDIPELAELFAPAEAPLEPPPPPPPARVPPPPAMSRQYEPEPEPQREPEPEPAMAAGDSTPWVAEPTLPSPAGRQNGHAPRPIAVVQPSTPWESEGELEPAPRGRAEAEANTAAPLGELFSDLDLPASEQSAEEGEAGQEPLAALGKEPRRQRAYVEETQHITKKPPARRGSGLKIALLLVVLLVLLPVGVLFALTEMQIVPLRAWRIDAAGNPVEQPLFLFSSEGMGALMDMVLGRPRPMPPAPKPTPKPAEAPKTQPAPAPPEATPPPTEAAAPGTPAAPTNTPPPADTAQDEPPTKDAVPPPKDAAPAGTAPQGTAPQGTKAPEADPKKEVSPTPEQIARVLERSQTTFKTCIDQVLRKNPKLLDTTLLVTTTVDSTGAVKKMVFDRQGIEGTASGECFKKNARKLGFPAISRDSMEVEIPIVLSRTQRPPPDDAP